MKETELESLLTQNSFPDFSTYPLYLTANYTFSTVT